MYVHSGVVKWQPAIIIIASSLSHTQTGEVICHNIVRDCVMYDSVVTMAHKR